MKALLVADNDKVINNITPVLKVAGYDTIVYRWLLKALDNIEEIGPHLIIISTKDYPRHWKTMAQFVKSGIGGHVPQIILFTPEDFSEDEKKKAEALGVRGTFDSVEVDGLDILRNILKKQNDIFSGKLINISGDEENQINNYENSAEVNKEVSEEIVDNKSEISENIEQKESADKINNNLISETKELDDKNAPKEKVYSSHCSFLFTDPSNGSIVTGAVYNYENNKFDFVPDISNCVSSFEKNILLENASLKVEDNIESVIASAIKLDDKTLSIKIRHCA